MKRVALPVILLVLLLGLAGCSSIAEEAAERTVEGVTGVDIDEDGEKITIEGEEGEQVEIGSGTELPEDFPSDVPVYEDAELLASSTLTEGEAQNYYLSLQTTDSFEDVVAWYKDEMESAGWELEADSVTTSGGTSSAILGYKKDIAQASFAIAQDENGETVITNNVSVR